MLCPRCAVSRSTFTTGSGHDRGPPWQCTDVDRSGEDRARSRRGFLVHFQLQQRCLYKEIRAQMPNVVPRRGLAVVQAMPELHSNAALRKQLNLPRRAIKPMSKCARAYAVILTLRGHASMSF
jgi:hypothetical protein